MKRLPINPLTACAILLAAFGCDIGPDFSSKPARISGSWTFNAAGRDPPAGLYEATIPELPGVRRTGSGRGEALVELSAQVAREVGMSPETCEEAN